MPAGDADRDRAVSHISRAYPDRVEVRGRDLCGDLMGRLSFTEYFHLLLTGREPTDDQRYFLDLLLVAIAEHGMMPTNVAARMTLAADPGSLQGAVAAGILGCGPVILGTSEDGRQGILDLYRSGDFAQKLEPYRGKLAELGAPMLALWGADDVFAPPSSAYRFQSEVPGTNVVVIEDAGHFVFEDDPGRCTTEVIAFLDGVEKTDA